MYPFGEVGQLFRRELNKTKRKKPMPAESLVQLCSIFNQIENDTQALVAQMIQINEQAAKFCPVGWKNTSESFPFQIQSQEIYLENQRKQI